MVPGGMAPEDAAPTAGSTTRRALRHGGTNRSLTNLVKGCPTEGLPVGANPFPADRRMKTGPVASAAADDGGAAAAATPLNRLPSRSCRSRSKPVEPVSLTVESALSAEDVRFLEYRRYELNVQKTG